MSQFKESMILAIFIGIGVYFGTGTYGAEWALVIVTLVLGFTLNVNTGLSPKYFVLLNGLSCFALVVLILTIVIPLTTM